MRGTSLDATAASPARVGGERRVVSVRRQVEHQFAEEERASGSGDDELGVAARPPQSAPPCPVTFQYRCRVAKGVALQDSFRHGAPQGREQAVQFPPHHVVIVLPVGIPGDLQFAVRDGRGREIVQGHADHRPATFHEEARVEAFRHVFRHVSHARLPSLGEPTSEERGVRRGDRPGGGKSAGGKAEARGLGFHLCGVKHAFRADFVRRGPRMGGDRASMAFWGALAPCLTLSAAARAWAKLKRSWIFQRLCTAFGFRRRHSMVLKANPRSCSHCRASGRAVRNLPMLFRESWKEMMEPSRA